MDEKTCNMSEPNPPYRVNLVSDAPAEVDAFGPHQRLANAIVDLIQREDGGRTIALEGGWGSGKSTVVNLVRKKLGELGAKENYSFILFDAWAHEGDPLRRTFLETLIKHFLKINWVKKSDWNRKIRDWEEKLEELARRKKITKQKRLPDFGIPEYIFALTLLLVPIGLVVFNVGLSEPRQIDEVKLGLALVSSPLWLFVLYFIGWWLWTRFKKRQDPDITKFIREAGGLLTQNGEAQNTLTLTIEAPEPTSVEFEDIFRELMQEALGHTKQTNRKFVLALDNLDRIASKDALSILSALQTFLQQKEHQQPEWFSRLYVDSIGNKGVGKRIAEKRAGRHAAVSG
jgi:hypothetical protein